MIGAKTLVTLTLLTAGLAAALTFGVLAPERLANRGWGTLFLVGGFSFVVGTLMFRFWHLGEKSRHYFRWSTDTTQWNTSTEAHFLGTEKRRITLGDNRGEAFDLGPRLHHAVCVAIALLLVLACIDARALSLLDRFERSLGSASATYCPDPESEAATSTIDPNAPGCELVRRAVALGYAKGLGDCAPKQARAAVAAQCTRRQRDEPLFHYAWRLLRGSWGNFRKHTDPAYLASLKHDFGTRVDRLGSLGQAERQMLASAPRASHHIWTNLPDPGNGAFAERSCADRYRWMPHRPAATGDKQASQVFEHVVAQLLFENRYEPSAGACREYHVHWGAALDTCQRLAADPEAVLKAASALSDVRGVLGRHRLQKELARDATQRAPLDPAPKAPLEPAQVLSFQCYFEGGAPARRLTPFTLAGLRFTAEELQVPPSPAGAALYIDRYDAVAKLLVHGFHYGALLSEAGVEPGAADGLQAAFAGHDYLLTRLYGLDSLDIYLDAGWLANRADLLEVYPYQRHLKNYVQVFRRQYRRERGRL